MLPRLFCCALLFASTSLAGARAQAADAAPPSPVPPASPVPAPEYEISISHTPQLVIAHAPGTLNVAITPRAPWLLKTTTPFAITVKGPESVEIKQSKFTARDFADPKSPAKSVSTTFTAKEVGEQHLTVDLMFFLCSDQVCQRHKEVKEYVVPVNATP